jgi:hypothetical protein
MPPSALPQLACTQAKAVGATLTVVASPARPSFRWSVISSSGSPSEPNTAWRLIPGDSSNLRTPCVDPRRQEGPPEGYKCYELTLCGRNGADQHR